MRSGAHNNRHIDYKEIIILEFISNFLTKNKKYTNKLRITLTGLSKKQYG
jgi:hypothetical protein